MIIGNPPYVVYNQITFSYKVYEYQTLKCANLYAFCSERSYKLLNSGARFSFIIPNSSISADKMSSLQDVFTVNQNCWISNYAWRPAKLFDGANMLLSIVITSPSVKMEQTYSSKYNRWTRDERDYLFFGINYNEIQKVKMEGSIPKLTSKLYFDIHKKLNLNTSTVYTFVKTCVSNDFFYYFRAVLYWVKILDRTPFFKEDGRDTVTGEMKPIYFEKEDSKWIFISLFSSSLYFLYYTIWSSCQVINSRDFQIPLDVDSIDSSLKSEFIDLAKVLEKDYQKNSEIITRNYTARGRLFEMEKQYFYLKKSKPIIDKLDTKFAQHYGFSEEELDFIINYDIKYRMGKALFGEKENIDEED